ncbi:MAG TPA: RNA polymerase sigma factor [Pyrinomonadaceae bacterium]|nr:RNA polymerase sigma factor [Pyrinomonadaceae bacterium]
MRSPIARGKINVLSEVALNRNDLPVSVLCENQTWLQLLIKRAAAGDTEAFEQLMIQSQQKVMAVSWRMLGNEADARDASQEVFLRIYKYLGRFKQDQDFFAWVYQITINVCRDFAKKRQRHTERFAALDLSDSEGAFEIEADLERADEAMITAQQRQLIASAMATLPDKERAAIVLRDVEGLQTDEVARILKSSSTTVRSQISSARRKIKLHCEQYLRRKAR